MPSSIRKMFSTKPLSTKGSKANSRKAPGTPSSTSIYSTESVDIEQEKREAHEAQRTKQAEDYLYKNYGFVSIAGLRIAA